MTHRFSSESREPLLEASLDYTGYNDDEKLPFPRLRVSRHSLLSFRTIFIAVTVVSGIVMSYVAQSWKLDRESAEAMRALDLDVAPLFLGKKSIDYFGRLRRANTEVVCKTVDVNGQTVDYSNSDICLQNAELHANCIRVCDPSFSSCGGCAALAADRANQLAIAQGNCNYKSSFTCQLTTQTNGAYDYVALSTCCLQSRPPGPDACMCTYQQSASALCILNGACLGSGTCQKSSFQCTGVTNSQPVTVCTNPGAVTCTISGGNEVDSTCGIAGGTQYYLNPATGQCVASCPAGKVNTVVAGVGTCTSCSGAGVATCSSNGTPTSCGLSGSTQYYLSGSTCVTSCPSGSSDTVTGSVGTCVACTGAGIGTGATSCSGSVALTCGTSGGTQYYLSSGSCVATCPSGTGGSVASGNGVCVTCPANALTCNAQGQATSCGQDGSITYSLNTLTGLCVSVCPSGFLGALLSGVTGLVCQTCNGQGTATCSGLGTGLALTCTTYQGVQYYLNNGYCTVASACPAGSGTFVLGLPVCNICADVGALTCAGTEANSATTCGVVLTQLYLTSSNTCTSALTCNLVAGQSAIFYNGNYVCEVCAPHINTCTGPNANQATSCLNSGFTNYYLSKTGNTCATTCAAGTTGSCTIVGVCTCS